jgi:hypothetical protein
VGDDLLTKRVTFYRNPVKKQSKHLFSWITSVFYLEEKDYVAQVGLDATMHIRFLRMVVHFLVVQSIFVCPVLLGLHWTGASTLLDDSDLMDEFTSLAKNESTRNEVLYSAANHHTNKLNITLQEDHFRSNSTLYYLSIANIPNNHAIVWVHVFFTFSISLVWLWLLFVNHIHHIDLLQQQPTTSKIHSRSVLITHVPHNLRNSTALEQHFDHAQIGTVEKVTLVSNTVIKLVETILKKRRKQIDKLEILLIRMVRGVASEGTQEVVMDWCQVLNGLKQLPCYQKQVEKVRMILQDIEIMDKEINRLRDVNRSSPEYYMPTGAAFVTFKQVNNSYKLIFGPSSNKQMLIALLIQHRFALKL